MVDVSVSKPKEKRCKPRFLRLNTNKKYLPDVFTGSTALRKVSLKTVQITYFKVKQAISKVLLYF